MPMPEPVEIVAVHVRILAEAIAVILFVMTCAVWIMIASGRLPA